MKQQTTPIKPFIQRVRFLVLASLGMFGWTPVSAQEADSWAPVASMPTARESVAACTINGDIYAIGGFPARSDPGITTVERYRPSTDQWTGVAPMAEGRRMPVAETVDGRCYVIGGRIRDTASPLASVEVYDPVSDRWQSRSPMPTPRFAHGSAVIDGRIHVVGGGDGSSLFNVHEVYDPATDRWSTLAPLPAGRALIGVTALGETMYVIGGSLGGNAGLLSLFIYDAATDSWSQGANLPSPRFSLQAAALNGRIYAVGGADGFNSVSDVTVYDPASDRWSTVSAMNTRRSRFALAEAGGQLYAIGGTRVFGGNDHEGMDLVERYTPAAAGAPFRINPGLNDAWFNPDTSGQGFFINVFPDTGVLFLAWFTYDTERPPGDLEAVIGEPGHRWLTAAGAFGDTRAVLDVSLTRGGVFDAPMPAAVTDEMPIGTITLEWDDCETATLRYDLETPPRTGEMGIRRVVADNIALCEALSAPPGSAADRR